jgi:carbon-monoxide dehydrogenase medium subunit
VKPAPFEYHAPETLEEALALRALTAGDSAVLAGGQSLIPILSLRLAAPSALVDIGNLSELSGIAVAGRQLSIGAATRQRTAERSAEVRRACALLSLALPWIGHPSTRNRGTVGGALAHADPAGELPAVALALEAELVVRGKSGHRIVAAADFFHGFMRTAVSEDELLVEVRFPLDPSKSGSSFLEVARRHGDFALVGVACSAQLDPQGRIARARIAFAGVGGTPVRALEAEQLLAGQEPRPELLREAAAVASAATEPHSDLHASADYRRHVAKVLARRALTEALERAEAA